MKKGSDAESSQNGSISKFEEYYEHNEEEHTGGNIPNNTDNNKIDLEQEDADLYEQYQHHDNDNLNNENGDIDLEREEMENDYELMKSLNDLKEKNKKLEATTKYQKAKITTLESELEKAITQLKLKDAEIEDLKSKDTSQGKSAQNRTASYVAQINNLNLQIDKFKSLINEKKNEYNTLLEKYNELHKKLDQSLIYEKKVKQEIISKDKQITKLIDELDKKNVVITSSAASQMKDKEIEKLVNENKKLEKQKNEIYAAFKKALKLCSILKREKVHLENARLLAFTEEEFKNLLEQNKI
jgi:chromosome segregation ATPase